MIRFTKITETDLIAKIKKKESYQGIYFIVIKKSVSNIFFIKKIFFYNKTQYFFLLKFNYIMGTMPTLDQIKLGLK